MGLSRNSSWGELLKNALAALSGISGFTLGQRTKAQSLSVTFPSDGGGITLGDVEIVDHSGNPLIGQKTMLLSLPVVIASNQTALAITGAVTNTVLTAVLNGTANALKNILVDGTGATLIGQKPMTGGIPVSIASDQSTLPIAGAVTNTVLTDIYDAINHLIRVSIQNASIAVTGTFWQTTQPISGSLTGVTTVSTITNDVGIKGLKALSNITPLQLTTGVNNPAEVDVPAGTEIVTVANRTGQTEGAGAGIYFGITSGLTAAGDGVQPGKQIPYPCAGLTHIYFLAGTTTEYVDYQFFGRS